jgi:peptidoglycan/LPS O-acetylase OafA/YrhL
MVLLGQASFAFYLLHVPFLAAWPIVASAPVPWLVTAAIHLTLILFTAIGVHLYLEKPAQHWLVRVLNQKKRGEPQTGTSGADPVEKRSHGA